MLGLIIAMVTESELVAQTMTDKKEEKISCLRLISGKLSGRDTVIVTGAYGKVSAAIAAQVLVDRYGADRIINIGVAGGLERGMHQCDFAVADNFVQHDVDTSAVGDPLGLVSGLYVDHFPADEAIRKVLTDVVKRNTGGEPFVGTFASGDQFVASSERSDFIRDTFGAIACDMESAAAAQACLMLGVPFGAIRCISDNADGAAGMSYDEFRDKTAALCAKMIIDAAGEL